MRDVTSTRMRQFRQRQAEAEDRLWQMVDEGKLTKEEVLKRIETWPEDGFINDYD